VTRGRVLALRALEQASGDGGSARLWPAPLERLHIAEAERLEARQVETADCSRGVAKCVRPVVSVLCGVRPLAGTDGIEHDDARPGHRAILGSTCRPLSASSLSPDLSSLSSGSPRL